MKRLIFLLLISNFCFSQNYTYFAGSRSSSLAQSSVSLVDIWSSFHNQAALAFLEKDEFAFSYQNRYGLKDLSSYYFSLLKSFPIGSFGLSISHFGFEQFNETKIGINYSRKFGETWSLGAQANFENLFIEEIENKGMFTSEFSILSEPIKSLKIGLHLYNPLNQDWENSLEFSKRLGLRFGSHYQFANESLLAFEIQKWADFPERYSLGFEYPLPKILVLRTGFSMQPLAQTIGFGIVLKNVKIDSSIEFSSYLGESFGLSLNYDL